MTIAIDNPTDSQRIGLIAGLVDGVFDTVQYEDFLVHNVNGSIVVTLNGRQRGGRYRVTEENFTGLLDWLEAKHELYGECQ